MLNAVKYDEDRNEFVAVEENVSGITYRTEFDEVRATQLEAALAYAKDEDELSDAEYALCNHESRLAYSNYEPDVASVNTACANTFWRGGYKGPEVVTDGFDPNKVRKDLVYTPEGLKLYPGWYGEDRTYTYWLSNTENYRFVLSIRYGDVVVTCWHNTWSESRTGRNKWSGAVHRFNTGTQYNAGDWQLPSSEQRAVLWLMKAVHKVSK